VAACTAGDCIGLSCGEALTYRRAAAGNSSSEYEAQRLLVTVTSGCISGDAADGSKVGEPTGAKLGDATGVGRTVASFGEAAMVVVCPRTSWTVSNRELEAPGELVGGVDVGEDEETLLEVPVMLACGTAPLFMDWAASFTAVMSAALGAPEDGAAVIAAAGLGTAALDDDDLTPGDAVGLDVTTSAGSGKLSSSSLRGLLLGEVVV